MKNIETTLGALFSFYGVDLVEAGFGQEDADTYVELWKGEDDTAHEGWHASAPYSQIDLLDEDLAPKDDKQAEEIRLGLGKRG